MEPKKKTSGKRNRRAGCDFERQLAEMFRIAGFEHVVTSRSESRRTDDEGIDLMNKDEVTHGRLPYAVQAKNSTERPQYDILLKGMPQRTGVKNVIIHKYTVRKGKNFHPRGYYAILTLEDFMEMASNLLKSNSTDTK